MESIEEKGSIKACRSDERTRTFIENRGRGSIRFLKVTITLN